MNVRPFASIEGRERGGSRPGLTRSHDEQLGNGPVRMLTQMTLALDDDFTHFSDTFNGTSLSSAWSTAAWVSDPPSVTSDMMASIDTSVDEGAAVLDALSIDSTQAYQVEVFIAPYLADHHGKFRVYARMDNTTPDVETEGIVAELVMEDATGAYDGTLTAYIAGTPTEYAFTAGTHSAPQAGWFKVLIVGNNVKCYWRGTLVINQDVAAQTGLRVGFGMDCTQAGGICLVDVFRTQYYSTVSIDQNRSLLIASADGDLYKETPYGTMTVITADADLNEVQLQAVQSGQKLYIADYGDVRDTDTDGSVSGTSFDATGVADWTALGIDKDSDVIVISDGAGTATDGTYRIDSIAAGAITLTAAAGTGACSYRIERAPKVYDPSADTLIVLDATAGQVPTGNPLIAHYLDRIVLGGGEIAPHAWYMSRQGTETDWDYAQTDAQRAVAGTASDAGLPGQPLTALVPHSDDYLIIACRDSIWRLRGDPAYGGAMDALSRTIGIVGRNAWCLGPSGELVFLSLDGIYILAPDGNSKPVPVSREILPGELLNIDPETTTISMIYDVKDRGVHIYLTPDNSNDRTHWWMDWTRKTFWPVSLQSDHEPYSGCAVQSTAIEESGVVLGGRDGYLRRYYTFVATDEGTDVESYAKCGPIALGDEINVGVLREIVAVMARDSGDVTWSVIVANSAEGVLSGSASATGTWVAGLNNTVRPGGRGMAFVLKLEGSGSSWWAVERITAIRRSAGKLRLR